MDKEVLFGRLGKYFDPKVASEEMRGISPRVMKDVNPVCSNSDPRLSVRRERGMLAQNFVRYYYRPFDMRWLYWEPETELLDEKRAEYFLQIRQQNVWLAAVQQNRKDFDPPIFTKHLCSLHVIERGANFFPFWLEPNSDPASLFHAGADAKPKPNLTDAALSFLVEIQCIMSRKNCFTTHSRFCMLLNIAWRIPAHCGRIGRAFPCPSPPRGFTCIRQLGKTSRRVA